MTYAWVLLDWDQHPLLHSHILVVEEVQVGLSFLLGLSLLDPFDFCKGNHH